MRITKFKGRAKLPSASCQVSAGRGALSTQIHRVTVLCRAQISAKLHYQDIKCNIRYAIILSSRCVQYRRTTRNRVKRIHLGKRQTGGVRPWNGGETLSEPRKADTEAASYSERERIPRGIPYEAIRTWALSIRGVGELGSAGWSRAGWGGCSRLAL